MSDASSQLGACFGQLVPLMVVGALLFWGRRVAARHGTRGWRMASWLPVLAFVLQAVGLAGTIVGLVRAFGAVGDADPAQKATMLAEGISIAMNWTALGVASSLAVCVASTIAFTIGSLRVPSSSGVAHR